MSLSPANTNKKYWAFISYSSKDKKWGQWLHKRLENYPIPREFQGTVIFDGAVLGKNLRPIFRDRDELAGSAELGPAILKALEHSRYLIVLCSKNSAKSQWVNKEIEDFKQIGGEKHILALIVDGEPNATANPDICDTEECFPPALRYPLEPLAGDLRKDGDGKERGFLKVLAGISQIGFDTLYQRHERAQRKKRLFLSTAAVLAITVLSALTNYAFHQKNLADRERVKSTKTLAHGDYIQAQQYRTADDYIMAFTHLARCLENDPGNKNAAYLAWAMITNENLAFPHSKFSLPEKIVDIILTPDGRQVVWIDDTNTVFIAKATNAGTLSEQRRLLTLSDTGTPTYSSEHKYLDLLPTGEISLEDEEGRYFIIIDPTTGKHTTKEKEEVEFLEINQNILVKIGKNASNDLLKTLHEQRNNLGTYTDHILIDHQHLEPFAEVYQNSTDLDSLVFAHLGSTSREQTTAYLTPSGQILLSQTRPVNQAHFVKELDTVLIESTDYVGASYLSNLHLATLDVRYCYNENFHSNIHRCRWVIDQANECLIASVEEGNYAVVYHSPETLEQASEFLSSDYQGFSKKAQRKATSLLVCDSPIIAFSYSKQNRVLAAFSKDHYYQFVLRSFSTQATHEEVKRLKEEQESPDTISTHVLYEESLEDFEILSESTHNNKLLSHLIDLNLIGRGSPISLPMPIKLPTEEHNLFFLGDNFWEYSHATLLCLVDHENKLVINQGRFASNHTIFPKTPYVISHSLGLAGSYWYPRPLDTAPRNLPVILNSLVMAMLDENNRLVPYSGEREVTLGNPGGETHFPATWHLLLEHLNFN